MIVITNKEVNYEDILFNLYKNTLLDLKVFQ